MPHSPEDLTGPAINDSRLSGESSPDDVRRLLDLSPAPAFEIDREETLVAANDLFARLLNSDQNSLAGIAVEKFLEMPDGIRLFGVRRSSAWKFEGKLKLPDGSRMTVEFLVHQLEDRGALIFVFDLSAREAAAREALESAKKRWQSDRIDALGRLAGGIAHDFNNFLAVLLLHIDILNLHLEPDSPARGRVTEIKDVANSIASTVRQLFAFGRKQPMTLAPVCLNPAVERFVDEFRPTVSELQVSVDLAPDLGLCFVDQTQIVQVLANLVENAKAAMPSGGVLKIETANIEIEHGSSAVQPPGPYVEISVSDTGGGMEPADEDHVFEPFFSARESDKGKGLALAMVYGIVKQSKGFIWVSSDRGKGTTFRIQFPRIDLPQPVTEKAPAAFPSTAGEKTVLLVDDEPAVRRVTGEFLEMAGYKVLQAGSGMEALEIAQAHYQPLDLLLTDLSMPLMDGRQLADRITRLHPESAVLFMSGNIEQEDETEHGGHGFISKPFSLAGLTAKVKAILGEGSDAD